VLPALERTSFAWSRIPPLTRFTRASGDFAAPPERLRAPPLRVPPDFFAVDRLVLLRPPLERFAAPFFAATLRVVFRTALLAPRFAVDFRPALLLAPRFAVDFRPDDDDDEPLRLDEDVPARLLLDRVLLLRVPPLFAAPLFRALLFRALLFRPPAALLLRPPLRVLLALAPRFAVDFRPDDFRPPLVLRELLDERLLREELEVLPDDFERVAIMRSWWRFAFASARIAHKRRQPHRARARHAPSRPHRRACAGSPTRSRELPCSARCAA
jgi:hypothetical protein